MFDRANRWFGDFVLYLRTFTKGVDLQGLTPYNVSTTKKGAAMFEYFVCYDCVNGDYWESFECADSLEEVKEQVKHNLIAWGEGGHADIFDVDGDVFLDDVEA